MMFPLLFHAESLKDRQDFSAQPLVPQHRDDSRHHTEFAPTEDEIPKQKFVPNPFSKNWVPTDSFAKFCCRNICLTATGV